MAQVYDKNGLVIAKAYDVSGNAKSVVYKVDGTPISLDPFLSTAVLTALPNINVSGTKQGACTDGEYIYQMVIGTFKGIKYKISDGTYTVYTLGSSVPYDHANDMAYNPNNGHIYVASMTSDGSVMELDKEFNYIRTHYLVRGDGLPYAVWGLCFNQKTNQFLSLVGNAALGVYDENFEFIKTIPMPDYPNATGQGCETDGEYIYRVTYNPNLIDVATLDGEFVKTINNPMSGEPETMMYDWDNGIYYLNRQSATDVFWQATIKKDI